MTHLYLTAYVGSGTDTDPFRPPTDQSWSAIDLRPDASKKEGYCLLRIPERENIGFYLGTLEDIPSSTEVETRLGLPKDSLNGKSVRQSIADILVLWGDEPGRWKSLNPDGHRLRIYLGELIYDVPVPAGGATIADDFVRADSTSLGASSEGWSWLEIPGDGWYIESNMAVRRQEGSTDPSARAEINLGTADHYAELNVNTLTGTSNLTNQAVAGIRFNPAAHTHYACMLSLENPGTGEFHDQIRKVVDGTATMLADTIWTGTLPWSGTVRGECEGSTIRMLRDGVERQSITDTSITGHVRTGLGRTYANPSNPAGSTKINSFTAADITATTTGEAIGAGTGVGEAGASAVSYSEAEGLGTGVGSSTGVATSDAISVGAGEGAGYCDANTTADGLAVGTGTGVGTVSVPVEIAYESSAVIQLVAEIPSEIIIIDGSLEDTTVTLAGDAALYAMVSGSVVSRDGLQAEARKSDMLTASVNRSSTIEAELL